MFRVYVNTHQDFSYESWINGMKAGNTFITNGPSITLTVNDQPMGSTLDLDGGGKLDLETRFTSFYPVHRLELIQNGSVIHTERYPEGKREGIVRHQARVNRNGWVAARLWGDQRDSFNQSIFAHTSPTYFTCGTKAVEQSDAANYFLTGIEDSLKWIDSYGRYNSDQQREDVRELFRKGREVYSNLI
ncbi:MAG: CehA/McbA family metallohydrolase [bacterium]|nr:CehA/McbA family metallohydrolase [bacterium]